MHSPLPQITSLLETGVLLLTLDRPAELNACTAWIGRELTAAFERAAADDAPRRAVVTAAGRAVCTGPDSSDGAASVADQANLFGQGQGEASQPSRIGGVTQK